MKMQIMAKNIYIFIKLEKCDVKENVNKILLGKMGMLENIYRFYLKEKRLILSMLYIVCINICVLSVSLVLSLKECPWWQSNTEQVNKTFPPAILISHPVYMYTYTLVHVCVGDSATNYQKQYTHFVRGYTLPNIAHFTSLIMVGK